MTIGGTTLRGIHPKFFSNAMSLRLFFAILSTIALLNLLRYTYILEYNPYKQIYGREKLYEYNWYFVALLFNNGEIINHWNQQLINIIKTLQLDGENNNRFFVSIVENGDSSDGTVEGMMVLKKELLKMNVAHNFVTENVVNIRKNKENRIYLLALLRNLAMDPLYQLPWKPEETRVVWLNDIWYTSSDILRLIMTNHMNYDMACGLDYYYEFYDIWVTRDIAGNRLHGYYPYFSDKISQNLVYNNFPVRVFSCWNGVIIMKAEPFVVNNVQFRYYGNESIQESECFYICKDFWIHGYNRILINPQIRVAYSFKFYFLQNYIYPWTYDFYTSWKEWFVGNIAEGTQESADYSENRDLIVAKNFENFV